MAQHGAGLAKQPVIVTGAQGFIGRHVCAALGPRAIPLSVRYGAPIADRLIAAIGSQQPAAIIHLGGWAHRPDWNAVSAEQAYRNHNALLTHHLAQAGLTIGIRRFVFASTIGVMGSRSRGRPLTAGDPDEPDTIYASSKAAAEGALTALVPAGLAPVIVRPPLVYGAGAPGNLRRLASAIQRGVPLPLGAIRTNRRSLMNVWDLADLLVLAADAPTPRPGPFLAADLVPVSTCALAVALGHAIGRPVRLISVPIPLLRLAGGLAGRSRMIGQLVDDLEIDASETQRFFGWTPTRGLQEGLVAFSRAHVDTPD